MTMPMRLQPGQNNPGFEALLRQMGLLAPPEDAGGGAEVLASMLPGAGHVQGTQMAAADLFGGKIGAGLIGLGLLGLPWLRRRRKTAAGAIKPAAPPSGANFPTAAQARAMEWDLQGGPRPAIPLEHARIGPVPLRGMSRQQGLLDERLWGGG